MLSHSKDRRCAAGYEAYSETGDGMSYRPSCSICKSTSCASFHFVCDIKEEVQILYFTIPIFNLFKNFLPPPCSIAARCTLAVGIVMIKFGDSPEHLHHVGIFIHHYHSGSSQHGSNTPE